MVKLNNTVKACVLFAGVLYLLYGGKLVNEWRGWRGPPSSGGRATAEYRPQGLASRAGFVELPQFGEVQVGGMGGQGFGAGGGQGY